MYKKYNPKPVTNSTFITINNNLHSIAEAIEDSQIPELTRIKDFTSPSDAITYARDNQRNIVLGDDKFWILGSEWNPDEDKVYARSTPDTAMVSMGGHYDVLGGANRRYLWGMVGWMSNGSTAPLTNLSEVSQGYRVRSVDATTRQIGADGDAHAVEIISGQWDARANLEFHIGSKQVFFNHSTFKGSRYCIGDEVVTNTSYLNQSTKIESIVLLDGISRSGKEVSTVSIFNKGSGYQEGDTIVLTGGASEVTAKAEVLDVNSSGGIVKALITDGGSYLEQPGLLNVEGGSGEGAVVRPTYITLGSASPVAFILSAPALASGNKSVKFKSTKDNNNIGLLISGSGDGGTDSKGNKKGKGIVIQAYGDAGYEVGLQLTGSGIHPEGHSLQHNFANCQDFIQIGSSNFSNSIMDINSTNFKTVVDTYNCEGESLIKADSSSIFTNGVFYLDGQTITTGSKGLNLFSNPSEKLGFWGSKPQPQPRAPQVPDNASLEELKTILNELINKLTTIGILG